ncbi:MAG: PTS sugar transporter subunit IIB [Clostridium sp.]|uniref:PTS sugar transporter subunit IIB n=1 Tax=Clostridium sp. TaxID=1506 RepID=UPI003F2F6AD9
MKNILLVCSAGMSTSLLVTKMEAAAKDKGIECHIEALAEADAHKKLGEVDVLLLGPQVRFLLSKFKKEAPAELPIEVIDTVAYGTMNGAKVLDRALQLIG